MAKTNFSFSWPITLFKKKTLFICWLGNKCYNFNSKSKYDTHLKFTMNDIVIESLNILKNASIKPIYRDKYTFSELTTNSQPK